MLISLFYFPTVYGQKVGVVLSGGGASGLAHIGFLKALEENEIPIDYITGTSMGAVVGGLYAAGYSPDEIEKIFSSHEFQVWTSGKIDDQYVHYFKKNRDDASWIRLKFSPDSLIEMNLPTNLINSTSLDFGLAELFAGPNKMAGMNFDSLFIPFRCVASDISSKETVMFSSGDLASSIRASISYPFYLSPVTLNGRLLYDGGLYDNFPVKTLCQEFEPDFIIGCNVSYNYPKPDEDNLLSQIQSMMSSKTDYDIDCKKGIVVEPNVSDIGIREFNRKEELISEGFQSTSNKMDSIKNLFSQRRAADVVAAKRKVLRSKIPDIQITKVVITGLKNKEINYVRRSLKFRDGDTLSFEDAKAKIMKLASDDKIKRVYPMLKPSENGLGYTLILKVKRAKKLIVSFGGIISSSVINEGFVGLQFDQLGAVSSSIYANAYFGRFYNSVHGKLKMDLPVYIPFQVHGSYTFNKTDYSLNSSILSESSSLSYLIQRENFGQAGLSFPISYKGKLDMGINAGEIKYEYYQDNQFTRFDTTDVTDFINYNVYGLYEKSSLNQKQYANIGELLSLRLKYVNGKERTQLRNSTPQDSLVEQDLSWLVIKFKYDRYFNKSHKFKFGVLLEGVYSDQAFFSNYANSILAAPSFEPIPESKIIFRSRFRAYKWGAFGLKTIYSPFKNFDIRLEGFMFQPFQQINRNLDFTASYDDTENRYFIGSFTLLYNLNFTQIGLNFNYYDNFGDNFPSNNTDNYSIMFHLGFVLFNEKMHD